MRVLLAIGRAYGGELEYMHRYQTFNRMPPQELLQRLKPVMARVDSELEAGCHIAELTTHVDADCSTHPFSDARCRL